MEPLFFKSMKSSLKPSRNRGVILITVLWIIVILTALSIGLSHRIFFGTTLIKNKMNSLKSRMAVESGLNYMRALLEKEELSTFTSLNDPLLNNETDFKDHQIGEGLGFTVSYEIYFPVCKTVYGLEPANGRLNLNHLTKAQVEKICDNASFKKEQMAALLDWIDEDDDPNNNGEGAEKDYYSGLEPPYTPSNKPLTSWTELYLVKGMTKEFADFLKTHFTLYGDGKVNINCATKETLAWLGMSDSLIEKIGKFITGDDGILGTEDDNSFKAPDTLIADLSNFESLSPEEISEFQAAAPFLTLTSNIFHARITPVIQGEPFPYQLTAVLDTQSQKTTFLKVDQDYLSGDNLKGQESQGQN